MRREENKKQLTVWENAVIGTRDAIISLVNFPYDFAQGFKKSVK